MTENKKDDIAKQQEPGAAEVILAKHAGGEYPVFCGAGVFAQAAEFYAADNAVIVSNAAVWELLHRQLQRDHKELPPEILIPDGEQHKTLRTVETILDRLTELQLRRDSTLIALGGGVVGDIAGFAAAIYMRGIRLLQMPTTLLAQVDSALGGKTGVNHTKGKNMIGSFYQPEAVFCDIDVLESLPKREYRCGLAEVVKYALLGDAGFFDWLEQNRESVLLRDPASLQTVVVRSVKMKTDIVAADERETGARRALLNLGHTFAHALEASTGYGEWRHGEAVAAGLVAAAKLSEKITGFDKADTARIISLLTAWELPVSFAEVSSADMQYAMQMDKKFTAKELRFVLMDKLGNAVLHPMKDIGPVSDVLEEMTS